MNATSQTQPQAPAKSLVAAAIFEDVAIQDRMANLYCRWQDEKEYEDIAEYAKAIEPAFAAHGAKMIKATKKPFGFVVEVDGGKFHYTVNSRSISYVRLQA